MVDVAQLVEPLVVVQVVASSSLVIHPSSQTVNGRPLRGGHSCVSDHLPI